MLNSNGTCVEEDHTYDEPKPSGRFANSSDEKSKTLFCFPELGILRFGSICTSCRWKWISFTLTQVRYRYCYTTIVDNFIAALHLQSFCSLYIYTNIYNFQHRMFVCFSPWSNKKICHWGLIMKLLLIVVKCEISLNHKKLDSTAVAVCELICEMDRYFIL